MFAKGPGVKSPKMNLMPRDNDLYDEDRDEVAAAQLHEVLRECRSSRFCCELERCRVIVSQAATIRRLKYYIKHLEEHHNER